jgi:hypothetical protein
MNKILILFFLNIPFIIFSQENKTNDHLQIYKICSETNQIKGDCNDIIERNDPSKLFYRNKDGLHILLKDKKEIILSDVIVDQSNFNDFGKIRVYKYFTFLKSISYHIVFVGHYEDITYLLINYSTGLIYEIDDLPVLSSDFKHFITVFACTMCPNRITIWNIEPDKLVQVFKYNLPLGTYASYQGTKWQDDSNIIVDYQNPDGIDRILRIAYDKEWKMTSDRLK